MKPTIIDLPTAYFGLTAHDAFIDMRGRSAGEGVDGVGQVVYGSLPRFVVDFEVGLMTEERARAWRTILSRVRGRVNVLRVRLQDPYRLTRAQAGLAALPVAGLPHSDGSRFLDGVGYSQSVTAPVVAAALSGATEIHFHGDAITNADISGRRFSIRDWVYECVGVSGSGADAVALCEPPLREAVNAGEDMNFDAVGLFKVPSDMDGRLAIDLDSRAKPRLQLVEWVGPERFT